MGIIYIIKNLINHKIYIGQTIRPLIERWRDHVKDYKNHLKGNNSSILYRSFKKHGIDNFVIFQFKECEDKYLDDVETFYIKTFSSLVPVGYNVSAGGMTAKLSKEERAKIRQYKKEIGYVHPTSGKVLSVETKNLMRIGKLGDNNPQFGKPLSQETKQKMSETTKKGGPSEGLPMYMKYKKAYPEHYSSEGYEINLPNMKKTAFTSKKLTLKEKYDLAIAYYNSNKPD